MTICNQMKNSSNRQQCENSLAVDAVLENLVTHPLVLALSVCTDCVIESYTGENKMPPPGHKSHNAPTVKQLHSKSRE